MTAREHGSASLEFIVAAIALFVPLVALTVTTSEIATANFAATSASRQGVLAWSRSETVSAGLSRVAAVTELALTDHGLGDVAARWEFDCEPARCHRRGTLVRLTVHLDIPLRFIPALPGISIPSTVTVSRSATTRVSLTSVNR